MKTEVYDEIEESQINKELKKTIGAIGKATENSTDDDRIKVLCLTGYLMTVCNNMKN